MTIINLTPHPITLLLSDGSRIIPSTGLARVAASDEVIGEVEGLPIVRQTFGEVEGLPAAADGTWLIVSRIVAAATPDRKDLLVPARLVRDAEGRIIGCQALEALTTA